MGSIIFPSAKMVYFTDQPENGHFSDLLDLDVKIWSFPPKFLDFNKKYKNRMTVCEFSDRSVKYTKRQLYNVKTN